MGRSPRGLIAVQADEVERAAPSAELVWYFAFGANMNEHVLVARRRIRPSSAEPARLLDHQLAFDAPGLPLFERAFANVHPSPGRVVHGVLYTFAWPDLRRLDRMEGEGTRYVRTRGSVARSNGEQVSAWYYRARWARAGRAPSRRYLALVVEAAERWGLPEDYVAHLRLARSEGGEPPRRSRT